MNKQNSQPEIEALGKQLEQHSGDCPAIMRLLNIQPSPQKPVSRASAQASHAPRSEAETMPPHLAISLRTYIEMRFPMNKRLSCRC